MTATDEPMGDAMNDLLVTGVGLWLPGVPDVDAWRAGARGITARDEAYPAPTGASIERRARRRAGPFSRALADAFAMAASQGGVDVAHTSAVFGSALGEVSTMLGLLGEMSRHEPLSPMAFATSVHSATAGIISISGGNRGFTTSISANYDTVGAALFEARGVLHSLHTPVVVTCGDESSPAGFVDDAVAFDMLAAAITLAPAGSEAPVLARLRGPHLDAAAQGARVPAADVPPRLGRSPQVGLLDLVAAILSGHEGVVSLDRGRGRGWCVTLLGADE